jgi:hypothetical protein
MTPPAAQLSMNQRDVMEVIKQIIMSAEATVHVYSVTVE